MKNQSNSKYLTLPVLFILGILNFDKFNGKLVKNKDKDIILNQGLNVYVMQVYKIIVEEETMLANYMRPGDELTIVNLFSD